MLLLRGRQFFCCDRGKGSILSLQLWFEEYHLDINALTSHMLIDRLLICVTAAESINSTEAVLIIFDAVEH